MRVRGGSELLAWSVERSGGRGHGGGGGRPRNLRRRGTKKERKAGRAFLGRSTVRSRAASRQPRERIVAPTITPSLAAMSSAPLSRSFVRACAAAARSSRPVAALWPAGFLAGTRAASSASVSSRLSFASRRTFASSVARFAEREWPPVPAVVRYGQLTNPLPAFSDARAVRQADARVPSCARGRRPRSRRGCL